MMDLIIASLWPWTAGYVALLGYRAFTDWLTSRNKSTYSASEIAKLADEISMLKDRIGPMQIALGMKARS